MAHIPTIIKESGEKEKFSDAKLERSLRDAGAHPDLIDDIVRHIKKDVGDGMSTDDIYRHAFALLRKYQRPVAARYSLKKAIMQLGPSGFPFEEFVGRILEAQGYKTRVGVMVEGACVSHEVDVVAEKGGERMLVECKFHNAPGIKTDLKVALYVHARFLDIHNRINLKEEGGKDIFARAWLITNTNFTSKAIKLGKCVGLYMTGWNFPRHRTLQDLVQETGVHPITCLTTLAKKHKKALLMKKVVLCRDLLKDPNTLRHIGVREQQVDRILGEALEISKVK